MRWLGVAWEQGQSLMHSDEWTYVCTYVRTYVCTLYTHTPPGQEHAMYVRTCLWTLTSFTHMHMQTHNYKYVRTYVRTYMYVRSQHWRTVWLVRPYTYVHVHTLAPQGDRGDGCETLPLPLTWRRAHGEAPWDRLASKTTGDYKHTVGPSSWRCSTTGKQEKLTPDTSTGHVHTHTCTYVHTHLYDR